MKINKLMVYAILITLARFSILPILLILVLWEPFIILALVGLFLVLIVIVMVIEEIRETYNELQQKENYKRRNIK